MNDYDIAFYADRDRATRFAAETILTIVQRALPHIGCAIDIGCGVGTWLNVLRERGIADILGIDGEWVDTDELVIPSESFIRHDLTTDLRLSRRYDLVISLEVAEHLSPQRAEPFVAQLTDLGDFVLFSAAIPGQGGVNHVNEQWPEYWIGLFQQRGYIALDVVRRAIWTDNRIAVHYRQNILLFVKDQGVPRVTTRNELDNALPLSIVHPQLYLNKPAHWQNPTIRESLRLLAAAIATRARRQLAMPG